MSHIRLFIARHGETDYNRNGLLQGRGIDAPLNETGQSQARHLAEYLSSYESTSVVSSSLRRAWETASFYEEKTDLTLQKNNDLDEMDFGDFEGIAMTEIAKELDDFQNGWRKGDISLRIPGGESPKEVFERADAAARSYISEADSQTVMLFIHGRLIRILLSEWLGYGLKNMHRIEHRNCGVNHLIFKNGKFEPVYLNKTDHLELVNID
ncbi:histidine phosphatase family protein [Rhodohalobacter sp. 614A]|uniref:histidine phosphatase family protein n=1 Tax=Rhodohalobacter sp. 614A TaxID=2908649 RepID=UPI001F3293F1|nr:histidine phosphatase family protein [Rhodohalobacter sp. 614A]